MFHRVKSEAQKSTEENSESMNKSTPSYDERPSGFSKSESSSGPTSSLRNEVSGESKLYERSGSRPGPSEDRESSSISGISGSVASGSERSEGSAAASAMSRSRPLSQRTPSSTTYGSGGYPGSSSYKVPAAARSPEGDRTLTIGAGITMSGEIESCDYLLVEGTVEAALKGARVLDIAGSGTFYGTVEIDEATIAGRFEGDLTVHGRLTVKSTGAVTGTIAYKEFEVESGAVIDGKIMQLSSSGSYSDSAQGDMSSTSKGSGPVVQRASKGSSETSGAGSTLFSTRAPVPAE